MPVCYFVFIWIINIHFIHLLQPFLHFRLLYTLLSASLEILHLYQEIRKSLFFNLWFTSKNIVSSGENIKFNNNIKTVLGKDNNNYENSTHICSYSWTEGAVPVCRLPMMSEVRRNFMVIQVWGFLKETDETFAKSVWELCWGSGLLGVDQGSERRDTQPNPGWRLWTWCCWCWHLYLPLRQVSTSESGQFPDKTITYFFSF